MTPGLRARKKNATRQAISSAALHLAVDHGPDGFTIEDIARKAEIAPRTVFNHFGSKEEAILGIDPDQTRGLVERLAARPADEHPLVSVREATREEGAERAVAWRMRAALIQEHPQLLSAYIATFGQLEDAITVCLAERLSLDPQRDPYPRLVAAVGLSALRVAVQHAVDVDLVADVHEVADAAVAAIAVGLPVPPGAGPPR